MNATIKIGKRRAFRFLFEKIPIGLKYDLFVSVFKIVPSAHDYEYRVLKNRDKIYKLLLFSETFCTRNDEATGTCTLYCLLFLSLLFVLHNTHAIIDRVLSKLEFDLCNYFLSVKLRKNLNCLKIAFVTDILNRIQANPLKIKEH